MVRDRTSPTKISHLCWSNVLYSFWALWWWVYLQGCLRTPFYHPINAGFMRGKRLGGFKRHFIQSKVFPVSKWSDLMVYSCCQSCVHFSAIGGECFLRRGFMRIFYQIQKKTFGKFLLQCKHAIDYYMEDGELYGIYGYTRGEDTFSGGSCFQVGRHTCTGRSNQLKHLGRRQDNSSKWTGMCPLYSGNSRGVFVPL